MIRNRHPETNYLLRDELFVALNPLENCTALGSNEIGVIKLATDIKENHENSETEYS